MYLTNLFYNFSERFRLFFNFYNNVIQPFWKDHKSAKINAIRTRRLIERADVIVVRFGDKYKQWNAAFDAGYAAALNKPIITLHAVGVVAVSLIGLVGGEAVGMSAALGVPLIVGGVAGVLAFARAAWASTSRAIRQKSDALIDTISRSLAETGSE